MTTTDGPQGSIAIRPAEEADIAAIMEMVNRFVAQNIMLPRSETSIRQTLLDWLVAVDGARVAGFGSLVPLTDTLVEVRSLAVHDDYQGRGIGGQLVAALVDLARERGYEQVCALTMRTNFFTRLGFAVVDRWSISPKVWQACIYCPKFHRCDEVAVLMPLVEKPAKIDTRPPGWNGLLRWDAWQPPTLTFRSRREDNER